MLMGTCHRGRKTEIALSPDHRRLAEADTKHDVTIKDATTWRSLDFPDRRATADVISNFGAVTALEFSPDGTRLAIGSADHKITVWDIPSGQMWATLSDDTRNVKRLAWRPDGHVLVSASTDNTLRLWSLDEDEAVREVGARIRSW